MLRDFLMDVDFERENLANVKAQIRAYDAALLAFASNGAIQQYTLDTGQTRQVVSRADIGSLRLLRHSLFNEYSVMCTRLNGGGTTVVSPCY